MLLAFAQVGMGALVAGLRAGLTYNTWPLMDGRMVPPSEHLWRLEPWWKNFFENITLVQFDHRMLAYAVLAVCLWHFFRARRLAPGSGAFQRASVLAGLVAVQVGLGILTLLLVVPIWAGLLHQAFAMLVLGMASVHWTRLK